MELTELLQLLKRKGLKGTHKALTRKINLWLEQTDKTLADLTEGSEALHQLIENLQEPTEIAPQNSNQIAPANNQIPQSTDPEQVVDNANLDPMHREAQSVLGQFRESADQVSQQIGNEMFTIYDGIVPNGISRFAEQVQALDQNGHYTNRAEFFRSWLSTAITGARHSESVDSPSS